MIETSEPSTPDKTSLRMRRTLELHWTAAACFEACYLDFHNLWWFIGLINTTRAWDHLLAGKCSADTSLISGRLDSGIARAA